jgi:hypothetical protein
MMELASNQGRLEAVCLLAATLADRMLMKQAVQGLMPLANAGVLWKASSLLEEYKYPVPSIVVDVLDRVRHAEEAGTAAEVATDVAAPGHLAPALRPPATLLHLHRPLQS